MGKLYEQRFGRCPHGVERSDPCEACDAETEAALRELVVAAARRMGAKPGDEISASFCGRRGRTVVTATVPAAAGGEG